MKELRQTIDTAIEQVNLNFEPTELYEPIAYSMAVGGKRMRPLLVLMGYSLFDSNIEKAIKPAIGVEMFHNFTLVHDDIMDDAPLRRNQQTVYKKWGNNTAILSGDAMMIIAYKYLSSCSGNILQNVLDQFNKTAIEVCEGQQMDMNFENRSDVSIEEYLKMIEYKTAVLLAFSLQLGAMLAGAANSEAEKIYTFGKHTGIAFQLQDDILDAFGEPEKFGKQPGGDIIANKKTFLLLKAIEQADSGEKATIQSLLSQKVDDAEKVDKITAIYKKLGVHDIAKKEMEHHHQIALQALEAIKVDSIKKDPLLSFTEKLLYRDI